MGRRDMEDIESLQKKELKLKRKGKAFGIVILLLAVACLILAWQSYMGKRDSWLFQDVLKIGVSSSGGNKGELSTGVSSNGGAEGDTSETSSGVSSDGSIGGDTSETSNGVSDAASVGDGRMTLTNLAPGGSTNYIFTVKESGWRMFETGLLSGDDSLEVDLSGYVGEGTTEVVKTTEYYGRFGNFIEGREETLLVEKEPKI